MDSCPQKALRIEVSPIYNRIGDFRWTADLILSHLAHGRRQAKYPTASWNTGTATPAAASTRSGSGSRRTGPRTDPAEIIDRHPAESQERRPAEDHTSTSRSTAAACRSAR